MTIEDQIRGEELQHDINSEAAKISALSTGRIDTYEYLTGEEILPSNQQQIIEQAKFTYSPLGKAFEKQTKTIEDQGEKQAYALKVLKPKEAKPIEHDNYFLNALAEIRKSIGSTDFNNLIYSIKDPILAPISFIGFKSPQHIFKSIHDDDMALEDVKKNKELLDTIKNIKNLYESREKVGQMFNDYAMHLSRNICELKYQLLNKWFKDY